jgi:hypothetical protein
VRFGVFGKSNSPAREGLSNLYNMKPGERRPSLSLLKEPASPRSFLGRGNYSFWELMGKYNLWDEE